jgi:hypothetical protein
MDSLSPSDIALLNDNNGFGNGNGIIWLFAFLLLANNGGWGNNNQYATQESVQAGFNNQAVQNQLSQLTTMTANNNYETANIVNSQTNQLLQQNNTNLVNAIQGFNTVNQNITNQTNQLSSKLDQLGYQMDQCCCSIKTQMLQDRLDDARNIINSQNSQIVNDNQSQYLLGQMGRWVGWNTDGTQTASNG